MTLDPPAHDAVLLTIRTGLDDPRELSQLLRRKARLGTEARRGFDEGAPLVLAQHDWLLPGCSTGARCRTRSGLSNADALSGEPLRSHG
jgi:hypothetical protein